MDVPVITIIEVFLHANDNHDHCNANGIINNQWNLDCVILVKRPYTRPL